MESDIRTVLVNPFIQVMSQVLEQIAGKSPKVTVSEDELPIPASEGIEIALRAENSVRLRVQFGETEAMFFATLLAGEPIVDKTERQQAVEELWRQIAGRATAELKLILKGRVLEVVSGTKEEWRPSAKFSVMLSFDGEPAVNVSVQVSREAENYFLPSDPGAAPGPSPSPSLKQQNLDLLLDVPLSLTLRFGERRMPLRDILQLSSGAVLELDRRADEPVELFLDERVIARGNVVVVDGCYGLRVTEVCNPRQLGIRR